MVGMTAVWMAPLSVEGLAMWSGAEMALTTDLMMALQADLITVQWLAQTWDESWAHSSVWRMEVVTAVPWVDWLGSLVG